MDYVIDEIGLNKCRLDTANEIYTLLKYHNRVACVRYTGFGKSYYILPKLIELFNGKTLIVVPNVILKYQYESRYKNNCNVAVETYQRICHLEYDDIYNNFKSFEYIICDECHHLGDNKWRRCIDNFNLLVNAKIVGFTATPIRGDSLKVVDNFFNGVQIEPIDLLDGINRRFVPTIKYVIAYADVPKGLPSKIKDVDRYEISKLINVPNILGKYIIGDMLNSNLKILVYVSSINDIENAKISCEKWFTELFPSKSINLYSIHSNLKDKQNKVILNKFRTEHSSDNIDIMVSVNMITEGLHLPSISIEIMLRKTKSPVTYFQQLGRVINNNSPIVFDMTNNINHLYQAKKDYFDSFKEFQSRFGNNAKVMFGDFLKLYDETVEIDKILQKYKSRFDYHTSIEIDNILNDNRFYIQENPDYLSLNAMLKYLNISEKAFRHGCKRLNIFFDETKYMTRYDKYKNIILDNKNYIESMSGKLFYSDLSGKLEIPMDMLLKYLNELNVSFKSKRSNSITRYDAQDIVKSNLNKINKLMESDMSITEQAKKFGMTYDVYKYALDKNNVSYNLASSNSFIINNTAIYKKFISMYSNKVKRMTIMAELNITEKEYNCCRHKYYRDFGASYGKKPTMSKDLTDETKQYIDSNYNNMSIRTLSEKLDIPRRKISAYFNKMGYVKIKNRRRISDETLNNIISLYNKNRDSMTFEQMATIIGCSENCIVSNLKRLGLYAPISRGKRNTLTNSDIKNLKDDYISGVSKKKLREKYHIGLYHLNRILGE